MSNVLRKRGGFFLLFPCTYISKPLLQLTFFPNTTFNHRCSRAEGSESSATQHSAIAVTPLSRYYKNKPHITE